MTDAQQAVVPTTAMGLADDSHLLWGEDLVARAEVCDRIDSD
jgi:hypothetical protein